MGAVLFGMERARHDCAAEGHTRGHGCLRPSEERVSLFWSYVAPHDGTVDVVVVGLRIDG